MNFTTSTLTNLSSISHESLREVWNSIPEKQKIIMQVLNEMDSLTLDQCKMVLISINAIKTYCTNPFESKIQTID